VTRAACAALAAAGGLAVVPAHAAKAPIAVTRVQVSAKEFWYALSRRTVSPGLAIVELANFGEDPHDPRIRRLGGARTYRSPIVQPGAYFDLELTLLPGRYKLWCSVADHERLAKEIPKVAKKHGVKATFIAYEPPCVSDPEDPFIKPMVEIVERVTGSAHETSRSYAVSEARLFVPYGIPTIVINPDGGGIHTDDEWLSRSSFSQFCQVLEAYVRRMAPQKPTPMSRSKQEVTSLAKRLNGSNKDAHVWYATYGTGLSKENFMQQIDGGSHEGSSRVFPGCNDKTPPLHDAFLSLPYAMYFAGHSPAWGGSSYINILPEPSQSAHTIARAYLITVKQFEEIVAHHNDRAAVQALPLKEAMQYGHATIGDGSGHYDELVFCGNKDGLPIFTVTAVKPELPYTPPNPLYTRMVCKGLSENAEFDRREAIEYMLAAPGIAGHYKKQDLAKFFKEFSS